jgi:hypothetical protein
LLTSFKSSENGLEKKNPVAVYFLFLITFGIYGLFWVSDIMSEINKRNMNPVYNQKKIWVLIALFLVWDFFLFRLIPEGGPLVFSVVFIQHMGWIGFIFFSVFHLARSIQLQQEKNHVHKRISPLRASLFIPLWFIGIPYVQHHMNILLSAHPQEKAA